MSMMPRSHVYAYSISIIVTVIAVSPIRKGPGKSTSNHYWDDGYLLAQQCVYKGISSLWYPAPQAKVQ